VNFAPSLTPAKRFALCFASEGGLSLPCFNYYKNLYYNSDNLKIVPSNIQDLLTPRGLAYWIQFDGSIQNKGLHLNTYGFTNQGVLNLKFTLEN